MQNRPIPGTPEYKTKSVAINYDFSEDFVHQMEWDGGRWIVTLTPRTSKVSKESLNLLRAFREVGIHVLSEVRVKGSNYSFDFVFPKYTSIHDYFGGIWHGDPEEYEDDEPVERPNRPIVTAKYLQDLDALREEFIRSYGFGYAVTWDRMLKNSRGEKVFYAERALELFERFENSFHHFVHRMDYFDLDSLENKGFPYADYKYPTYEEFLNQQEALLHVRKMKDFCLSSDLAYNFSVGKVP